MNKILAIILFSGLLTALTLQADVDIYITGSTAFRNNAYNAIRTLYGAGLVSQNPADPASSANVITWTGTISALYGAQTVNIRASWGGSIQGVKAMAQNDILTFFTLATPGDTNTVTHVSDLAFSDVFQLSTAYKTPALSDKLVCVQPFVYAKSVTTPGSVTNINFQQLQEFLANGNLPLSYFTGNNADDATLIYLVGRNTESGTRLTAEADDLFVGTPTLWQPDGSCNWTITPGFSSGGGIVGVLNGSCGPAIGYLGVGDAKNTTSPATQIIKYNGGLPYNGALTATPDFTPVIKGQYSYWSYEHLFRRTTASADIIAFRDSLATAIDNDIATLPTKTAVRLSQMLVHRDGDGTPIFP